MRCTNKERAVLLDAVDSLAEMLRLTDEHDDPDYYSHKHRHEEAQRLLRQAEVTS